MKLNDYRMLSSAEKDSWLRNYPITIGLRYFGGKSRIGKYLMNRIFNMAVKMDDNGKKADIFIDAFTGGGKLGLSMPEGWFDTIVINDLDYGVASYYQCCKDKPQALIELIEVLGKDMNNIFFKLCAYNHNNGKTLQKAETLKKRKHEQVYVSKEKVEPLLAAAMTYWVTKLDFMGKTSAVAVDYRLGANNVEKEAIRNEKEEIQNMIAFAREEIPKINKILHKKNIIIENLDYRELIKKYNGKDYKNADDKEYCAEEWLAKKNKLWYFDPPYHPVTLSNRKDAPYEETFDIDMVREMTSILHNENIEEYGELEYFIKSDYNPKYMYHFEKYGETAIHDFDVLEENDSSSNTFKNNPNDVVYYVECVGEFEKGAVDAEGEKSVGREYIWCRGNYQGTVIEWE